MKIGAYYYPEQWPREQWERDFDNMAALGLQLVHMGEFAWHDMEPGPHDIRLNWLSDCVEMAAARGMETILCTPTAAPPIWFADRYSQALPMDEFGRRARFGGRRHYTPTSLDLHEAAWRIVSALGERFGHHPHVVGWQIDNELSSAFFDQSEQTHRAFRNWLNRRYGNIDSLNEAWGCAFWNTSYQDFEQILMPPSRDPQYRNPHQCLDASRFWSWAHADFARLQIDALKFKIDVQRQFITTNFMPMHLDLNPSDLAKDLTLFSWDTYPLDGRCENETGQNFRIGDPAAICLMHAQMASFTGRFAVMELQPGQTNWTGTPVQPHPGAVRLWLWTAFAHGAEFVTTYRFRQARFGIEMFHAGLVGTDGQTLTPGGREFAQVIDEMRLIHPELASKPMDDSAMVGLLLDFEQLWYFQTLPQTKQWDQIDWLRTWYAAISRLGLSVRVLVPGQPWPDGMKMVIAPGVQMVDGEMLDQFVTYASNGGHLVLTCRTGLMDRNGHLFDGGWGEAIWPLIGGRIDGYDALPSNITGTILMNDRKIPWNVWGDQVSPDKQTRVLATYADQPYAGSAAITQADLGKGQVTYCGVYSKIAVQVLMETIFKVTTTLPDRVHLCQRGNYRICLNHRDEPMVVPADESQKFIVGSRTLDPCGVAVWTV